MIVSDCVDFVKAMNATARNALSHKRVWRNNDSVELSKPAQNRSGRNRYDQGNLSSSLKRISEAIVMHRA